MRKYLTLPPDNQLNGCQIWAFSLLYLLSQLTQKQSNHEIRRLIIFQSKTVESLIYHFLTFLLIQSTVAVWFQGFIKPVNVVFDSEFATAGKQSSGLGGVSVTIK